jgi:hypothetical protein
MSKAEILAELPKLSAQDRREIFDHLWQIEEQSGPTGYEKAVLDEAQAAFVNDPKAGSPWPDVLARLQRRG